MTRKALTETQIAALAAGAPAAATAPAAEAATEQPAAEAATEQPAAEAAPAAEVTEPKAEKQPTAIELLQTQLSEANAKNTSLQVDLAKSQDRVAGMEASFKGLMTIAAAAVANMKVAMGLSKVDLSALSAEQLVAEHASTSAAFVKAFPIGGVAAVNTEDPKASASKPDPFHLQRVAATRLS